MWLVAVQRPAGVDLAVGGQRLLRGDRQQAQVLEPVGDDVHRGVVRRLEVGARPDRVDAGLLGGEHERVEVALQRRERAVDRQRAGHVGGVEVVALHAHVEQQQLAGRDRAAVLGPVQGGGVEPPATIES